LARILHGRLREEFQMNDNEPRRPSNARLERSLESIARASGEEYAPAPPVTLVPICGEYLEKLEAIYIAEIERLKYDYRMMRNGRDILLARSQPDYRAKLEESYRVKVRRMKGQVE